MNNQKRNIKRTNSSQFAKLVELMEANPDIARGIGAFGASKKNQAEYWDIFAAELNPLGPPSREGKEWHKVWLDYKLKLKKKLADNKADHIATGGGPYRPLSLSPLEQAVDQLLSLQAVANPSGNNYGVTPEDEDPGSCPPEEFFLEDSDGNADNPNSETTNASQSRVAKSRQTLKSFEGERMSLLQRQTETQEKILNAADSIKNALSEIAKYSRKGYEIKKEKLELLKAKEERKNKNIYD